MKHEAFRLHGPAVPDVPLVLDSPHSGCRFPSGPTSSRWSPSTTEAASPILSVIGIALWAAGIVTAMTGGLPAEARERCR